MKRQFEEDKKERSSPAELPNCSEELRKREAMNSSHSGDDMIPPDCQMYILLGGRLPPSATVGKAVLIFLAVINIATLPFATILNALVIMAVKTKTRMRVNKSNILLACLAATDLMVGVVVEPLHIALLIKIVDGKTTSGSCALEIAARTSSNVLCISSLIHLALISGERYLAMKYAYAYHNGLVTETRLLVASAVAWLLSLILHIPLFFDQIVFYRLSNTFIAICLVMIVFCHIMVYRVVRRHEKEISNQQVTEEARRKFLKDKKAFKLTAIIIAVLFLCYVPKWTLRIVVGFYRNSMSTETVYSCLFVASLFVILNSLVNPLIYSVRMRQFRVAFVELTCRTTSIAEAEEIEMRLFGSPNTVARLEEGQQNEMN